MNNFLKTAWENIYATIFMVMWIVGTIIISCILSVLLGAVILGIFLVVSKMWWVIEAFFKYVPEIIWFTILVAILAAGLASPQKK